jgi:hypothetical protein
MEEVKEANNLQHEMPYSEAYRNVPQLLPTINLYLLSCHVFMLRTFYFSYSYLP